MKARTGQEIVEKAIRDLNRMEELRRLQEQGVPLLADERREWIALRARRAIVVLDKMAPEPSNGMGVGK